MDRKWIKRCIRAVSAPLYKLRRHTAPEAEIISVKLNNLPDAFRDYRIAVVSDLHLPDCISTPAQIITALKAASPDCILVAGDLTNRYNIVDTAKLQNFLKAIAAIAPCYAIAGNHERAPERLHAYRKILQAADIPLLCEDFALLEKHRQGIALYGVCDPHLPLPKAVPSPAILLIHYPHRAARAAHSGFALAVSGHAHGGQIRLGKLGIYAPGQGFFAKYVSGLYKVGDLQIVVSRGLGDSSLPIRFQNRPHLPIIVLQAADPI